MNLPAKVQFCEVGSRDGLQFEAKMLTTAEKIQLVNALSATGLSCIEVTSFVSPKWVPQLADAEAVLTGIVRRPGVKYRALAPNVKGTERALGCDVDELFYSIVSTEIYSRKNWNMSVDETLAEVGRSVARVRQHPKYVHVVGSIGVTFGCPYEGNVPLRQILRIVEGLLSMGVDEINLADSAGMGNPLQVQRVVSEVRDKWPNIPLSMHLHNTRGMGQANLLAALSVGIDRFDSSIGGIGGCPFAPSAAGNICTEDAVHMMHEMGIETGIDLAALIAVAKNLTGVLDHPLPGLVHRAGTHAVATQ